MRRYTGIQKMSTRGRVEVGEMDEMRMKGNSSWSVRDLDG